MSALRIRLWPRLKLYNPPLIMVNITDCKKTIKSGKFKEGDYLKLINSGEIVRVVNIIGSLIEVFQRNKYFYIIDKDATWIAHSQL